MARSIENRLKIVNILGWPDNSCGLWTMWYNPRHMSRACELPNTESSPGQRQEERETTDRLEQWLNSASHSVVSGPQLVEGEGMERYEISKDLLAYLPGIPYGYIHGESHRTMTQQEVLHIIQSLSEAVRACQIDMKDPHIRITEKDFSVRLRTPWLLIRDKREVSLENALVVWGYVKDGSVQDFGLSGGLDCIAEGSSIDLSVSRRPSEGERYSIDRFTREVIDEDPCTVDKILQAARIDVNKFAYVVNNRVEISRRLGELYAEQMNDVQALSEVALELHRFCGMSMFGKEALRLTENQKVKDTLRRYKDECVEDVLSRLQAEIVRKETARSRFHRKIEAFCYVFLQGMNRVEVVNFLESIWLERYRGAKPLIGKIMVEFEPPSWRIPASGSYAIFLGNGDTVSVSPDGEYTPAPSVYYESRVSRLRTRDDDIELADHLAERLQRKFPYLECRNEIVERGSFHECFAGNELRIDTVSIVDQAARLSLTVEALIRQIEWILIEEIEPVLTQGIE